MKIRIEAVPPGFALEEIRRQWVGVEIPIPDDMVVSKCGVWTGAENENGYVVFTADAVEALKEAGRHQAVMYWECIGSLGKELRFGRGFCTLVEG